MFLFLLAISDSRTQGSARARFIVGAASFCPPTLQIWRHRFESATRTGFPCVEHFEDGQKIMKVRGCWWTQNSAITRACGTIALRQKGRGAFSTETLW